MLPRPHAVLAMRLRPHHELQPILRVWSAVSPDAAQSVPVALTADRTLVVLAGRQAAALLSGNEARLVAVVNEQLRRPGGIVRLRMVETSENTGLLARVVVALLDQVQGLRHELDGLQQP